MSVTAGDLTAYLRLDRTQFDSSLQGAESKFSTTSSKLASGSRAMAGVLTTVGVAATGVGVAVAKIGVDYNRLQQNSRAALKTILGGTKAASEQMDRLDKFAENSPFAKQIFITAQQQLLGFGVQAKKVIPILDGVQNAVAAVGGSGDQVGQITYALAQMQGQGKLTGETLNQVGQYGIDMAGILGKQIGKTGAEIRDLVSKPGGIPVDEIWDPLVKGLNKRFGGATKGLKKQLDGATDRIKAGGRDLGAALAAPFVDPQGGGRAVIWANEVADLLYALKAKAAPLVDLITRKFGKQMAEISIILLKAKDAVNNWDLSKLDGQLDKLAKYAPLISGVGAAIVAVGAHSIPILGGMLPAINPVVAGLAALVATSPGLRSAAKDLVDGLGPLKDTLLEAGQAIGDVVVAAIDKLAPSLDALVTNLAPVVVTLVQSFTPALVAVVQAALPIVTVVADVVSWISKLPTPVLAGTAAFVSLLAITKRLSPAFTGFTGVVRASMATVEATGAKVGVLNTAAMTARVGVRALGTAMKTAFISSGVGIAIAAVSTAIGVFIGQQEKARQAAADQKQVVDDLTQAFIESSGAIKDNARQIAAHNLESIKVGDTGKSVAEILYEQGENMHDLTDAYLDVGDASDRLTRKFREQAERGHFLLEAGTRLVDVQTDVSKAYEAGADAIDAGNIATDKARQNAVIQNLMVGKNTDAVNENTSAIKANTDAKKQAASDALSLRDAQLSLADAQDSVKDAIQRAKDVREDDNATKADVAKADRDVEKALNATVDGYERVREKMIKQGTTAKELTKTTKEQRQAFIGQATAAGMSEKKAKETADTYGLIPKDVRTEFVANTDQAKENVTNLHRLIEASGGNIDDWDISADGTSALNTANGTVLKINEKKGVLSIAGKDTEALQDADGAVTTINGMEASIKVGADTAAARAEVARLRAVIDQSAAGHTNYMTPKHKAAGGGVHGPGTGTSDSILAALSNGEHVWTAREVQALGGHAEVERLRKAALAGKIPAFKDGGRVAWAKNKLADARDTLGDAHAEMYAARASKDDKRITRANKGLDAARQDVQDWRAEVSRLKDQQRQVTTAIRRGTTLDAVAGGLASALGVVDQLSEQSRNKDLSKKKRKSLAREAKDAEKALAGLYKQADKTRKALGIAKDHLKAMKQIRDSIASSLSGEFTLAGLVTTGKDAFGETKTTAPTAKGMVTAANKKLTAIKSLAGKLDKLAAAGLTGVILQEIASSGTETGNLMADALLADTTQIKGLNTAYAGIAKWSKKAGTAATANTTIDGQFYAAGIHSARIEVDGLKESLSMTRREIKKIGKALTSTLLGSLGLKVNKKGRVVKKAEGGWVTGGTPGVDSVPVMAMPDEFVVRAKQAAKWGPLLEAINSDKAASLMTWRMPSTATTPAPATTVTAGGGVSQADLDRLVKRTVEATVAAVRELPVRSVPVVIDRQAATDSLLSGLQGARDTHATVGGEPVWPTRS